VSFPIVGNPSAVSQKESESTGNEKIKIFFARKIPAKPE
jgi:hypothetical protein